LLDENTVSRLVLPETALNGGFPEPPADEAIRVVAAHHDACGASTRVRLPSSVPARAVRRFHCASCAAAFEARRVEEIELRLGAGGDLVAAPEPIPEPKRSMPKISAPKLPSLSLPTVKLPTLKLPKLDPQSRGWKLLSIPIAALLVIAGLLLVRGGDEQGSPVAAQPPQAQASDHVAATPAAAAGGGDSASGGGGKHDSKPSKNTEFVRESSYSLALPAGWERVDPPAGATFSAIAADGGADATLWITRDPKLDFPTFISQSLAQLETLAGSAQIVERVPGPSAESTIVRIGADAPAGQPTYEVTLRVAGPYRYYLATTVQPDASAKTIEGADLIPGSLTPELEG
jgi:hypothetical protein